MKQDKIYHALGLMSGSSLDGLDMAYCQITWDGQQVKNWHLLKSKTIAFSEKWKARLAGLPLQNALVFAKTNTYFGHYLAEISKQFITEYQIKNLDFIASHGHTIFHEPDKRISIQIGDGAAIAALTGIQTITNFRTQDIALDGEGAPLAPLADKYLFEGYDFYLNIGGIANLSANIKGKWLALDCCPANQILNSLASEKGASFDHNGHWASQGKVQSELLKQVANFEYYQLPYPKSLGNGWIRSHILPIYLAATSRIEDRLATACEHIALEIAKSIQLMIQKENFKKDSYQIFLSGGGTFNGYLLDCIHDYCNQIANCQLILPSQEIIEFKEAALMAILGVLRLEGVPNSLKSATGAKKNTVNGAVYFGS